MIDFVKVRILKNDQPMGRAYTYKTEQELSPGDKVILDGGKHGIVVDEPVDVEWIKAYGTNNIKSIVGKVEDKEDD